MNTTIHVDKNEGGIINTGNGSTNVIQNNNKSQNTYDIKWEKLNQEISVLKSSSDSCIKKFAHEAEEAAEKKDKQGLLKILSKWIPCIADLISSSYYIIEIAKNFNIG